MYRSLFKIQLSSLLIPITSLSNDLGQNWKESGDSKKKNGKRNHQFRKFSNEMTLKER